MIEEGISKIEELVKASIEPKKIEVGSRIYYDKDLIKFETPMNHTEEVGTLTGFSDLVAAHINQLPDAWAPVKNFIHVLSPTVVTLSRLYCNEWGRRQTDVICKLPAFGKFSFGEYLDQERFIIGLQSFFDPSPPDMEYLYRIAGNLTAEQVQTGTDDGLSQKVAMRTGVVLAENAVVERLVTLKPWRTFREIAQPESTFIFRLKTVKDEIPVLALLVADGEKWQLDASQAIKTWLTDMNLGLPVIA